MSTVKRTFACYFVSDINFKKVEKDSGTQWGKKSRVDLEKTNQLCIMCTHRIQGSQALFPKRTLSWLKEKKKKRTLSGFVIHRLCKVRCLFGPQFPQLYNKDIGVIER